MHGFYWPKFVFEVYHQRPAFSYWADDDQLPTEHEREDMHACIICESVGDLIYLTKALDGQGCQARHQAARIAAQANDALEELCDWLSEGMPEREVDHD